MRLSSVNKRLLHLWKQDEVHRDEIRRIGRVGDQRDGSGGEPVLGGSGCVDLSVIPAPKQSSVKNGPVDK